MLLLLQYFRTYNSGLPLMDYGVREFFRGDYLDSIGAKNIHINQQQTTLDACRIGTCRPDVQAQLPDGRMIYIEYDTAASTRGLDHAARLNSNDPKAIVILKRVN